MAMDDDDDENKRTRNLVDVHGRWMLLVLFRSINRLWWQAFLDKQTSDDDEEEEEEEGEEEEGEEGYDDNDHSSS